MVFIALAVLFELEDFRNKYKKMIGARRGEAANLIGLPSVLDRLRTNKKTNNMRYF